MFGEVLLIEGGGFHGLVVADGCSYWLPYPVGPLDARKAQHEVHYPYPSSAPNVYVCGESWSCCQTWMEGAVRNAQGLFDEHL